MVKQPKYQTKKGGASIYVTIFVALIISVVTLSFARLAVSELSKAGDTDLNQSAYDSALAGIEDAKIAISGCIKEGKTLNECKMISANDDDCNLFLKQTKYIQRTETNGAVFIEEKNNKTGSKTTQAYTCVTMKNDLPDYLGQLNPDYRVRVIPLKTKADLKYIDNIVLSWYENSDAKCPSGNCDGSFGNKENAPVPPVLSFSIIQAGENFNREDLNNTNYRRFGSTVLYPNGNIGTNVAMDTIPEGDLKSAVEKGGTNAPRKINCHSTDAYACSVRIKLPADVSRYNNTTFVVIAMPYDNTSTSFKVAMNDGNASVIDFHDAQIAVDSTGRANDIYRRVEARVDTIDTYYPYPVFGFESGTANGSEGSISKDFWLTRNCWMAKDGGLEECGNTNVASS